ncbi:MAG: complex I NDUFA9 subunit family protein [Pseudomonadota bacterium]
MNDKLITVFGGDGFVGRYVVQALLKSGARVRIVSRNPKRGWFLKAQANLGQIAYVAADVMQPETIARALNGADIAINLVGSFANMDMIQNRGAQNVAAAAAAKAGVGQLVHMSAIGADSASPSAYGKSKGDGEAAVRAAFPAATIIRPSIIFGREDQFINRFAGLIRLLPIVPVFSAETRFQPVFVGDVAHAVMAALANPEAAGKTFELGGPQTFSMLELNKWIAQACGREKYYFPVSSIIGAGMAKLTGWLPGAPMTWDQWLMLQSDNVVSEGASGLSALGIVPTPLEAIAPGWLVQYRKHGRFGAAT